MKPLLIVISLAIAASSSAQQTISLFNGRDLAEWTGAAYEVKDGVIISRGKNLVSKKQYRNYTFEFDFLLPPHGNNGLGIHYPGSGGPSSAGMELQILDNSHPKYAKLKDTQYHGSIYKLKAAKRGFLKHVGEWNRQKVIVNGPRIIVELNGTIITEANLDELEKKNPRHKGVKRRSGHLCFCGHGSAVKLRNLTIVELPD